VAEDRIAVDIIRLRDAEKAKQANFRSLYQEVADYTIPREVELNRSGSGASQGQDISLRYIDGTQVQDAQILAAGLASSLVGPVFFALSDADSTTAENDAHKRWCMIATQVLHAKLFASNFRLHLNSALLDLSNLGTTCLYEEYDHRHRQFVFKHYDIALYQIKEDSKGRVDTVIISYELTARQAAGEFGSKNLPEDIAECAESLDRESERFPFIHITRPRLNAPLTGPNRDMPFESIWVAEKQKVQVRSRGYRMLPFAVARWRKSASEKYGRGQGCVALADIRMLQKMRADFIKLANRQAEPPLMADSNNLDGTPDMRPSAINWTRDVNNSLRSVDQNALGNPIITAEMLEAQRSIIHEAYFRDLFRQFTDMQGDRRTAEEVRARKQEALKNIADPAARTEQELLQPIIERSLQLSLEWGDIPPPPPTMKGYQVEYLGQLALAQRDQHATAGIQFVNLLATMAQVYPEGIDSVDFEKMIPDIAAAMGVKSTHLRTSEAMEEIRRRRSEAEAEASMAEAMGPASQAYSAASKAPEAGSPAEAMMEAVA